jgi:hypothetical protein
MRDPKVFVHSGCERDRDKVRELHHYVRDLMVVERDMSLRRAVYVSGLGACRMMYLYAKQQHIR